ncbi:succinate dehydrogenase [Hydrogenophaga sp. 2FB]|uniref:succinate dehydrogenase n=1 Tax=Hydrogenophaga sp. 2FB TaxID=2502187 RepID=UPI0010F6791D|nr:succinate dehydrogenase [Hydrogenophaga sp. 2FB]
MEQKLFALQRLTAMIMAPFVLIHVGLIVYAVQGGLTAGEILSRTQGSLGWITFYTLFVVSVAIHVPIGVRNILIEWAKLTRTTAGIVSAVFSALLLFMGLRAVVAVGGLLS